MKKILVIPARFNSSRLPGKPLADVVGKPLIQRVYERAKLVKGFDRLVIAVDDERVEIAAKSFGAEVIMTDPNLVSGTDRVAAVAEKIEGDLFVNFQGDEPLLSPQAVEAAADLVASGKFGMGTVMTPIRAMEDLWARSVVKVLVDAQNRALYFSRLPIPYGKVSGPAPGESFICRKHLGVYAYDRATLFRVRALPEGSLEKAERLEQLRALEAGIPIGVAEGDFTSIGVDTFEDLEKVRKHIAAFGV